MCSSFELALDWLEIFKKFGCFILYCWSSARWRNTRELFKAQAACLLRKSFYAIVDKCLTKQRKREKQTNEHLRLNCIKKFYSSLQAAFIAAQINTKNIVQSYTVAWNAAIDSAIDISKFFSKKWDGFEKTFIKTPIFSCY